MEIYRTIAKTKNLSQQLETALRKDIINIVQFISDNYTVYRANANVGRANANGSGRAGNDEPLSKDTIFLELISEFGVGIQMCAAVTKTGTKCCKRAADDTKYCKTHMSRAFFDQLQQSQSQLQLQNPLQQSHSDQLPLPLQPEHTPEHYRLQLIDDTFYYVDDHFIYDKHTLEKVGYIERNRTEEGEFILTDDPFILDRI